jgi:hypothetical protein
VSFMWMFWQGLMVCPRRGEGIPVRPVPPDRGSRPPVWQLRQGLEIPIPWRAAIESGACPSPETWASSVPAPCGCSCGERGRSGWAWGAPRCKRARGACAVSPSMQVTVPRSMRLFGGPSTSNFHGSAGGARPDRPGTHSASASPVHRVGAATFRSRRSRVAVA